VKGEVKVLSYSGEYDHFESFGTVSARKGGAVKTLKVEAIRFSGETLLLKFAGIDSPEQAKLLADFELWVPRENAAPLEPGEVYLADLVGCALIFSGEEKGKVTGYLEGGSAVLLEVVKTDGSTCVVPFMDVYLGNIDLTGRTIELKADWLLE
jgi:16S rRNA processing protein RimM